jgi:hypothetical protein
MTSYLRCLGLKGSASSILVAAYEGRFSEPKMPCSRDTVNTPATITSSMTSGIHSRLRTLKIAKPPHPFPYPAPSRPLEHATTPRPRHARKRIERGGRRRIAVRRSPQAMRRLGERVSILTSKPCRWPPYRLLPNARWDRNAYHLRKGVVRSPASSCKSRGVRYLRAAVQLTFQRARACRVAKRHKARPIAASSTGSHHHRNPAPRTNY